MKNIEHENFIGIYDDFFSNEYCQTLIEHFEWCKKSNRTYGREVDETFKSDTSANLNPANIQEINFSHPNIQGYIGEFNKVFWDECYADYRNSYSILNGHDEHTIYTYKIQKTLPGQGYHIWHCENSNKAFKDRLATYILYLNDGIEGGETEFLYMSKRISAKTGRLIIFPSNYPWTHRGNPPLSGVKYIMTGWVEFS